MNEHLRESILEQLRLRGFTGTDCLDAPQHTMSVTAGLLDGIDILDFLDWMCVRREKMYWSVEVLGREVATAAYEDVLLVVDAVKTVLRRELALPAPAA